MSTAPLLDWISTSFSHDRNLNAWKKFFFRA
jgi:hypothetical protein